MVSMPQERLKYIESPVEILSEMVRNLQSQNAQNSSQWPIDAPAASIAEPEVSMDQTGHLCQQGDGRMRYVEPTFWASLSKEVADLDELLTGQMNFVSGCGAVDESEWSTNMSIEMSPRFSNRFSFQAEPGLENVEVRAITDIAQQSLYASLSTPPVRPASKIDFLRQLPPKALADSLFEGYTNGHPPMVPLFHMPTFRKRYEAFWLHVNDSSILFPGSISFAALLLDIL